MTNALIHTAPVHAIATRAAVFQPSTFNESDNSCEIIWTTGATVRRSDWIEGEYDETLATAPENVRLDRLNSGGPVLANHDRASLTSIVGSVVPGSARMENGRGIARIRFASTDDVAPIVARVREGHLRSVSAGYIIHAYRVADGDARRSITVVDWEPLEVSLVPIPADAGSFIRSGDNSMPTPIAGQPANNAPEIAPIASGSVTARAIMTAVRNAGLDVDAASEIISAHETAPFTRDGLSAEIGRRYALRDSPATTNGRSPAYVTHQPDQRRGMEEAIFARMSGSAPTDHAREYMGASLTTLARHLLENNGVNARLMSDVAVIERSMHATGDFPSLLLSAGNRFLMQNFEVAASAVKQVARERLATDFRDITNLKLGGFSGLERLGEGGEIKHGTFKESEESYRLASFAKIFSISRNALINDDLGAFSDPLRLMARAAAETEATELAALLTANSGNGVNLGDGLPLYHASHGNKAPTGGPVTVANLGVARQGLRDQKDLDGKTPVNSTPKFLLVGTAGETQAEMALAALSPATVDQANPFSGRITPLVEPRLQGQSWRLFADPAQMPVIEYAYLSEARGPQLDTREGWNVLGMEFRVVLDFGCTALDHRGTYLNSGQ